MNTVKVDEAMNEYFVEFDKNIEDYKLQHFDEKIRELKNIHNGGKENDAKENK